MSLRTPLFFEHEARGARMVPFAGWDMPLHYGSQIQEHHAVRRDAGMFDVSHMAVLDLEGEAVTPFLRRLLANDVARLAGNPGKALYSCLLREDGGVLDDLIVYFMSDRWYRMVVNAGTADKDTAWIRRQAEPFGVAVRRRDDLAMIAVQGPNARTRALPLLPAGLQGPVAALKPFVAATDGAWFVGRTGYTGEDGLELMLPAAEAPALWRGLAAAGVAPCGLGARDTLRLEAGMNLYGSDMDETVTPLESALTWTVAWEPADRDFIGRAALESQRAAGGLRRLVGLVLEGKGVLRDHQKVFAADGEAGEVTSGGFAPTLDRSIALARVDDRVQGTCEVEIRRPGTGQCPGRQDAGRDRVRRVTARVVRPPFVRQGRPIIEL